MTEDDNVLDLCEQIAQILGQPGSGKALNDVVKSFFNTQVIRPPKVEKIIHDDGKAIWLNSSTGVNELLYLLQHDWREEIVVQTISHQSKRQYTVVLLINGGWVFWGIHSRFGDRGVYRITQTEKETLIHQLMPPTGGNARQKLGRVMERYVPRDSATLGSLEEMKRAIMAIAEPDKGLDLGLFRPTEIDPGHCPFCQSTLENPLPTRWAAQCPGCGGWFWQTETAVMSKDEQFPRLRVEICDVLHMTAITLPDDEFEHRINQLWSTTELRVSAGWVYIRANAANAKTFEP